MQIARQQSNTNIKTQVGMIYRVNYDMQPKTNVFYHQIYTVGMAVEKTMAFIIVRSGTQ